MRNVTFLFFLLLLSSTQISAQLYQQQFSTDMPTVSNGVVTDATYVGTPASASQLTYLGTNTSGSNTITVSGGTLNVTTSSTSSAWGAVRNENFSGSPTALKISFTATIDVGSSGSNHKWFFYVGSGFTNGQTTEAAANNHSGFSIRYGNSAYYYVKTLGGTGGETVADRIADATSLAFTFVTNNTGTTLSYVAPDGSVENLANDTWDLWLGTTKKFNDQAATTASQSLNQIKFGDLVNSSAGRANWTMDNLLVEDLNLLLPVKLEYFKGKKVNNTNAFNWKLNCTTAEHLTIDVQRSSDARNYINLSQIKADYARCAQPFEFTEAKPVSTTNYYRLKITNQDGKISYSNIVALINGNKVFDFAGVYPTLVTNETNINISSVKPTTVKGQITDMNGKIIMKFTRFVAEGNSLIKIDCSSLAKGNYVLTGFAEGMSKTVQLVKL